MRTTLWLAVALLPASAGAHTLDEYLQTARLSLTRSDVGLDLDLTPGAAVAASIVALIDSDGDGVISPVEAAAYGNRVLADTVVELDGTPVAMTLTQIEVPPIGGMREGMATIQLHATGAHRMQLAGHPRLAFRNDHAPQGSVYAVNALIPTDRGLSVSRQDRDVYQRSIQVRYDVHSTLATRIGWSVFALVTSLGFVARRRTRRL